MGVFWLGEFCAGVICPGVFWLGVLILGVMIPCTVAALVTSSRGILKFLSLGFCKSLLDKEEEEKNN